MAIHIVSQGETIYSIAEYYGVSPIRLSYDNQIGSQSHLVEGQSLLVLVPEVVHRISQGESARSIADIYGIPVLELYQNNPFLLNRDYLPAGETIVIRYVKEAGPIGPKEVTGYAYPFINRAILREALLYVDELLVFSYGFTMEGELVPPAEEDTWMIAEAKAFGKRPILVLTPFSDGAFDNRLVSAIIENQSLQSQVIEKLMMVIDEKGYQGIDIDFEYILPEDAEGYAKFVEHVGTEIHKRGWQVSVALAPKTSSDQPGLLYEGMDYKRLGESADKVFLMTYEWGYTYGPPMAVAPIDKVREVLDYAITQIPEDKILMGIPNYGYDWSLPFVPGESRATLIGNVEAVVIASQNNAKIEFDEVAASPYFLYTQEERTHEVWFEDARSIDSKVRMVGRYEFRGFGYWNLMRTFRANWLLIHQLLK